KADGAVESYAYDSQNRLVGYSSATTTANYAYDALDRRIAKVVDGAETAYVYDLSPEDPLAHDDIVMEYEGGILTRRWMHSDAVDEPVGFEEYTVSSGVGSGTEHALYADRQGSVIWVTEPATGSVVAGYEYDGYGQITQTVGSLSQPYGYTGREYDAESGLYHYRARAYDPAAGVFVQSDPIGFLSGSLALDSSMQNDPFNLKDPSGLVVVRSYMDNTISEQANTTSGYTSVGVAAISLAGEINAALSATLPFALKKDGNGMTTTTPRPPGVCQSDIFDRLNNEVKRWKAEARECLPIPKAIFGKQEGMVLRMNNLRKQQAFSRLALARATLQAVCFPGYYGPGDHRQAVADALEGMAKCHTFILKPVP
ncbi:MAG: hypothetical protein KDE03_17280, partial [Rhodobacteraceae bacterium]|nr:hypothetical protein [Paracoccaceae bacterium]